MGESRHDADDPVRETAWLQAIADDPRSGGFPHAIVAGADLARPDAEAVLEDEAGLDAGRAAILYDPQTSGGLLIAVAEASAPALLEALLRSGHRAAEVGDVVPGPPRLISS